LDWSFDLLIPEEQKLLIRISVFAGGWTLEAAEQICSGDDIDKSDVLGLIFGLADKSLVVVVEGHSGTRYRLLEPLRQYASKRLAEAGGEAPFRRQHAEHFAQLAEEAFYQLVGADEVQWLNRLEDEADNLRAALAWHLETDETQKGQLMAGALYRFFGRSLRALENRTWLHRMLDADPTPGHPRARALLGLGTLSDAIPAERVLLLDESLKLYRTFGPDYELGIVLNNLAVAALSQGDWHLAAKLYEEKLERGRRRGDDLEIVYAAQGLTAVKADWEGDLDAAALLAEEALASARRSGSGQAIHNSLGGLARVKSIMEDFPAAISALEEALEIEERPGARIWDVGSSLLGLAEVVFRAGNLDQSLEYLSRHYEQISALGYDDPGERVREGATSLLLRGKIEVACNNHKRGVILIAATSNAYKDFGEGSLTFRKDRDATLTRARQALGEEAFRTAWNEGLALTLSQALDYGLHQRS
jgi:non-specific serine/threonine protein kinase